MKGIYLSPEGKALIEAKIAELENQLQLVGNLFEDKEYNHNLISSELRIRKEILSSATILPVEESYNNIQHFETSEHGTVIRKHFLMANYSNGVIIQPKQ